MYFDFMQNLFHEKNVILIDKSVFKIIIGFWTVIILLNTYKGI